MLNRYPFWKYLLILILVGLGGLYALPNIYPDDPAVQISGSGAASKVDVSTLNRVTKALSDKGLSYKGVENKGKAAVIRFANSDAQLKGKAVISSVLGGEYLVAFNLAPTTPDWLVGLGGVPMKLGLDLRGGVHFLIEVQTDKRVEQQLRSSVGEIKTRLREKNIRYRSAQVLPESRVKLKFEDDEARDRAVGSIRSNFNDFLYKEEETDGAYFLVLTYTEAKIREIEDYAVKQNLTTLRNRVNELGVAEPLVQRQGRDRIVVQLPGIQDPTFAKKIIGATANLEIRLEALPDAPRSRTETFEFRDKERRGPLDATLEKDIVVTGDNVVGASAGYDENGQSQVSINLDSRGGKRMNRITQKAVKRSMAVLYIEQKSRTHEAVVDGVKVNKVEEYEEKSIISLAQIQTVLGNRFRVTGLDNPQEASEFALLLRAGSLAAPIKYVEERTVGPSLGQENIDLGVKSVQIGLCLVLIFMLVYYRVFGLFANIALSLNLLFLIAIMSILSATLTLPGIAGIVLTVGMAVDANVLIFARIREELKNGLPVQSAIHAGYERAFTTIFDANLTTLLVAVILFGLGTGPVKGFAVTLCIGILTSMFTAIVVTRAMVNLVYGGRSVKKLLI